MDLLSAAGWRVHPGVGSGKVEGKGEWGRGRGLLCGSQPASNVSLGLQNISAAWPVHGVPMDQ